MRGILHHTVLYTDLAFRPRLQNQDSIIVCVLFSGHTYYLIHTVKVVLLTHLKFELLVFSTNRNNGHHYLVCHSYTNILLCYSLY